MILILDMNKRLRKTILLLYQFTEQIFVYSWRSRSKSWFWRTLAAISIFIGSNSIFWFIWCFSRSAKKADKNLSKHKSHQLLWLGLLFISRLWLSFIFLIHFPPANKWIELLSFSNCFCLFARKKWICWVEYIFIYV